MSGHQGYYDGGYGHQDSYYQEDHNQGYYDQNDGYDQGQGYGPHGGDGYYDEACVTSVGHAPNLSLTASQRLL